MAITVNKTQVDISVKDRTKASLKKLDDRVNKLAGSVGILKGSFVGLAGAAGLGVVIKATAEQERVTAQLNQAVKSTGMVAGFTSEKLAEHASKLQGLTTYSDEAIMGMQSMLLTFTNLRGDVLPKTTEAVLNLSTRMDQDLKSSAVQLGKALNDPIANLGALSRSGIQFSESQKYAIKALAKSGQLANAQGIILKELDVQFGGAAVAARDTFGGALQALNNAFGDLLEAKDGLPQARLEIESLTKVLSDPTTKAGADAFMSGLISSFSTLAGYTAQVGNFTKWLGEELAAQVHGPADLIRIEDEIENVRGKIINLSESRIDDSFWHGLFKADNETLERRIQIQGERLNELIEKREALQSLALPGSKIETEKSDKAPPSSAVEGVVIPAGKTVNDKISEALGSRIDMLTQSFMTEEERLHESYERRSFMVEDAYQNQVINEQLRVGLLQKIEEDHQTKLSGIALKGLTERQKFAQLSTKAQAKAVLGELQSLTAGVAQHDKRMFEINKVAGIANAVINTYQGVTKTMAAYPYPVNIGLAAASLAAGLSQVNAIRSTSFSGGGSAGGVGSAPAPSQAPSSGVPTVPASQQTPGINLGQQDSQQESTQELNIIIDGERVATVIARMSQDGRLVISQKAVAT